MAETRYSDDALRQRTATSMITAGDAASIMDRNPGGFLLLADGSGTTFSFVTDRQLREAALRGLPATDPVARIASGEVTLRAPEDHEDSGIYLIRSAAGAPTEVVIRGPELLKINEALVVAGGLGTRMGDLTRDLPKPMIPVAGRPLIEHVLRLLSRHGIMNVTIATNYLGEKIEEHVGCGAKFGVSVRYIREEKRLGTAGALSLLDPVPDAPFFVINADIVTKVNLRAMAAWHGAESPLMSVGMVPHVVECPYGVIQVSDKDIIQIQEKPRQQHWINAGVYVLSPEVAKETPRNVYIDMTTMIQRFIKKGERVCGFPIREYWNDAATPGDIERLSSELQIPRGT